MIVTDAMPSVGMIDKTFILQGQTVKVVDGVCVNADGTLAGSDLDTAGAVRNSVAMLGISLDTAVRMAGRNPAAFLELGNETGRNASRLNADLVALDAVGNVTQSWIAGVASAR